MLPAGACGHFMSRLRNIFVLLKNQLHSFVTPAVTYGAVALFVAGSIDALLLAPKDYQQLDIYRVLFIHAPSAWGSFASYIVMTIAGIVHWYRGNDSAGDLASASAIVGLSFTVVVLATGALWGGPTWGIWWAWDLRTMAELVLVFFYGSVIYLRIFAAPTKATLTAANILAVAGAMTLPVNHLSVYFANTIHQLPSVLRIDAPAIDATMLRPLWLLAIALTLYYFSAVAQWRCWLSLRRVKRVS